MKFGTRDAHKTVCFIDSEVDFQRICHIHLIFNSAVIDLIVDANEGAVDVSSGSLIILIVSIVSLHSYTL